MARDLRIINLDDLSGLPINERFVGDLQKARQQFEEAKQRVGKNKEIIDELGRITDDILKKAWDALKKKNIRAWQDAITSAQSELKNFLLGLGSGIASQTSQPALCPEPSL